MVRTLALLAFAEVADLATTIFASTRGAHEGNPVFLAALAGGSVGAFVVAKFGLVPIAGCLIGATSDPRKRSTVESVIRFGSVMLLGVAASNVLVGL